MIINADFHLHSKYSRATSQIMDLESISIGAKLKGLNLLGTGDFTHPKWFSTLKNKLKELEKGLYVYGGVYWMLTCEVALTYSQNGKSRRIHHLIHAPSIEVVEQINDCLSKYGDLSSDGRPNFNDLTSPELVELMCSIDKNIFIIPSHAWTTWYGIFGANTGFKSLQECFQEKVGQIFAIETGLSSDPPMNWRISALDRIALVSNSDSHSPLPSRLGREFNVFDLIRPSYEGIFNAIKTKDKDHFLYTVEVPPEYGKYHYTGHKTCSVFLDPEEAVKINNICPVCNRKLTVGVMQRVEELADRPAGYVLQDGIPYKLSLPLYEIISYVRGTETQYSRKIEEEQLSYIKKAGSEISLLFGINKLILEQIVGSEISNIIERLREKKIDFEPGYDGVYGKLVTERKDTEKGKPRKLGTLNKYFHK